MWFNKNHPNTLYVDERVLNKGQFVLRPNFEIKPDIVASFTELPLPDKSFHLVVFDPPHTIRQCKKDKKDKGIIALRYGRLMFSEWEKTLELGFRECWRVLKRNGTLVFKWAESDKKIDDIKHLFPSEPLFGSRVGKTNKTHWLVFFKE